MTKVKYLQHASFTAAEWVQRNPLLLTGEIGFELDEFGLAKRHKVGPGLWNDLGYAASDEYPYSEHPTNEIGDAKGDLLGKPSTEILNLMLNPFQSSVVSAVQNDAGGILANSHEIEIGNQLSGNILLGYSVTNQANLIETNPINVVSSHDIYSNLPAGVGDFPFGNITLALTAPLQPATPITYTLTVKATDTEGQSAGVNTSYKFSPRIQWGTSPNDTIDSILSGDTIPKVILNAQKFKVTSDYTRDYDITNVGYTWLIIPQMLNITNPIFTDVTDPNAPASYAMQDMGSREIDTTVGVYTCQFYRSVFYLNSNGILRVT